MQLQPYIDLEFNAPIWRMEIDELNDTLLLEVRDIPNRQVSFAGVDLNRAHLNFKDLTLPERWLSGLEAANNGVMLVHGFQGETVPVHKGLTAVDGVNGNVLWSDYNIIFESTNHEGFIVSDARIQPKKYFNIDAKTGQRTVDQRITEITDIKKSNIQYPITVTIDEIPTGLNANVYGNEVHYLSHNNFRIVSLHALCEGVLTQHLYVLNGDDIPVFEDLIAGQIQKLQPEAFISYKNKLIWLKNRSVLKVLNL